MKRRLVKTASGTVIHNSSPAEIENLLIKTVQDELGKSKNSVAIKPYLQVDEYDNDTSQNVKHAFGAIRVSAGKGQFFLPFIIADKTLLPFDVIRMGEQEISYDYAKLQKLVESLNHMAAQGGSEEEGDIEDTMELVDLKDIKPDNGFLGTIMDIRDNHHQYTGDYQDSYTGPLFGQMDDERIMRTASEKVDILDTHQEVMEKIAGIEVFTPEQLKSYEEFAYKEALAHEEELLKKAESMPDSIETAAVKRDMLKLQAEKFMNVHSAASGNNITFPTFDGSQFRYRNARFFKNFESNTKGRNTSKPDALVLCLDGSYRLLKRNQPFMISLKAPEDFEFNAVGARALKEQMMYTAEINDTTVYTPFIVKRSYKNSLNNEDRMITRYNNGISSGQSSLFSDAFDAEEVTGKSGYGNNFQILVSKDPNFTEPTRMTREELKTYVSHNAKDAFDIRVTEEMYDYYEAGLIVPEQYSFIEMRQNISDFYTKPDGVFTEGPITKTAGAYDSVNKATLKVESQRKPYTYSVNWSFKVDAEAGKDVSAYKVERRSSEGLSENQASELLGRIGFDFRDRAKMFEIVKRNGRSVTFDVRDTNRAAGASAPDRASSTVKKKMKGIADSMLNSRNFMPIFTDTLADGFATVVGETIPGAVEGAKAVNDTFNWTSKSASLNTAAGIEKVATQLNGSQWHEISALTNLKHQLDKVAEEIWTGNHLYNAEPVFEKLASLQPVIVEKQRALINFNREQLTKVSSPLVNPNLVKEAIKELDGLYRYASFVKKKELNKEAGIFRPGDAVRMAQDAVAAERKIVAQLEKRFRMAQTKLRAALHPEADPSILERIKMEVAQAEQDYQAGVEALNQKMRQQGTASNDEHHRNLAVAGGVGLPGLAGLGYANEAMKNE